MIGSFKLPMPPQRIDEIINDALVVKIYNETPGGVIDGANQDFTLTNIPGLNSLRIYLNGVRLRPDDYTVAGAGFTLDAAPYAGDSLTASYDIYSYSKQVSGEVLAGDLDGVNKDFVLTTAPDPSSLQVYLNGIQQAPDSYTLDGDTITLDDAPYVGDRLVADYRSVSTGRAVYNETPAGVVDGTNAAFLIAELASAASEAVYLNGIRQARGPDYTLLGKTITFTVPPYAEDWILIDYQL